MSYWPEEDRPKKEPGPFDEVFADAKEGALTWPVRDHHGLVEIKGPIKILGAGWVELRRRDPVEADRVKKSVERLMAGEGRDATGPWLILDDSELDER